MANRHKVQKKAGGGKVVYSGAGSPTAAAAKSGKSIGIVPGEKKCGGRIKKAAGGRISTAGATKGGGNGPYSSAKC